MFEIFEKSVNCTNCFFCLSEFEKRQGFFAQKLEIGCSGVKGSIKCFHCFFIFLDFETRNSCIVRQFGFLVVKLKSLFKGLYGFFKVPKSEKGKTSIVIQTFLFWAIFQRRFKCFSRLLIFLKLEVSIPFLFKCISTVRLQFKDRVKDS